MASFFLGINRGKLEILGGVTASTSTTATDFEIRMDTGKSSTKEDVIKAMRLFEIYILSNGVGGGAGPGVDLPPN